jgi:hypothetical protein
MNHFRPVEIAFSTRLDRNPAAATASKAVSPIHADQRPVTAMIVPITVTAEMLMAIASARLSPVSPQPRSASPAQPREQQTSCRDQAPAQYTDLAHCDKKNDAGRRDKS